MAAWRVEAEYCGEDMIIDVIEQAKTYTSMKKGTPLLSMIGRMTGTSSFVGAFKEASAPEVCSLHH
jgi:hypothetical protein